MAPPLRTTRTFLNMADARRFLPGKEGGVRAAQAGGGANAGASLHRIMCIYAALCYRDEERKEVECMLTYGTIYKFTGTTIQGWSGYIIHMVNGPIFVCRL
jgi:hypothetical protein